MTRARMPSPREVDTARRDPRLLRAARADNTSDWRADALCQEVDPEVFFPPENGGNADEDALDWCRRCPVQAACLATALNLGDADGVWGNATRRERRAMLVAWRIRAQVPR